MQRYSKYTLALLIAASPTALFAQTVGPVAGGGGGGSGTVTSVALSAPGNVTCIVTGSPVTTSGTLVCTPAGTSGGVPYFNSASSLASSGALTANAPVLGGGAGAAPTVGSRSGNTTTFATTSGTLTNTHAAVFDANGNIVDFGGAPPAGTVTSVASGAGLTGGPITTTGTLSLTELIRAVTGTTDTILSTDAALLVTYSNASAIAVTLPQATGSFAAGFAFSVQNKGAGTVTITPTTSTINGASTLAVTQNQGCDIVSDGTNWQVSACTAVGGSASGVSSITGTANQITASASTGAVTLSLPAAVQTTSLALGGATIGSNNLAVTGTAAFSGIITSAGFTSSSTITSTGGNVSLSAAGQFNWTGKGIITSPAAGDIQLGAINGAAPVAQTLGFQNGAGTNIAGQNTTIQASVGSGNAAQGNLLLVVGQPTSSGAGYGTALTGVSIIGGTAEVRMPNIAADTAKTDASACVDTTNKGFFTGTGTLGICLGTSTKEAKTAVVPLGNDALLKIERLNPVEFNYRPGWGYPTDKRYFGFLAEDMQPIVPELVGHDAQGRVRSADYLGLVPVLVKAVQEQQREIEELWTALGAMFLMTCGGFVWLARRR